MRNGSGTGIPGTRDLTKIQCGIRETLTGYRIGSWIQGFDCYMYPGSRIRQNLGKDAGTGKKTIFGIAIKKSSGCARMQDRNSFSISDPIRTKESGHCIVMVQFNIPGGGGYSPIKVTGLLVVPFRGLNLWIGNAYGTKT